MDNVEPKTAEWRAKDNMKNIQTQTVQTVVFPRRYEQCRVQHGSVSNWLKPGLYVAAIVVGPALRM